MIKFAERLKELRLENNLSQTQLATETGFSQAAIARWENGKQITNIEVALIISNFFKVSTDYLIGKVDYLN